jgi:DNA-binding transcriptional regulator YhcF (GntR family)
MEKETQNNGNGWICLHRAFKDWQHYGEPSVMVVFIDLLLSVNAKDGWWRGHKCERGATFRSIRSIAEDTTLSFHTIIRAMRMLEQTGEIKRIRIDQKNTKTIVCNFSKYQDISFNSVAKSATQSATQNATQSATKQQYNNDNNIVVVENNNTHARTKDLVAQILAAPIYLDPFLMQEHISKQQFEKLATVVVAEWQLTGETHRNATDEKKHLFAHIRKKVQAMREQGLLLESDDKQERLARLINDCKALIAEGFPRESVAEFYAYWTQDCTDQSGRMMFETTKAWNTRTRFLKNFKKARS